MKILVFAEKLGQAAALASHLGRIITNPVFYTISFSEPSPKDLETLGKAGVDKVYNVSKEVLDGGEPCAAAAVSELAKITGAELVVVWASKTGNEIAARAAQRLDAPYASECISLEVTAEGIVAKRLVLGGGYVASLLFRQLPAVVSMKTSAEVAGGMETKPNVEKIDLSITAPAIESLELIKPEFTHIDLEKADIIVAVGRGFKKKEDLSMAEEMARLIGGELGCTRPISGDLKWMGEERHIGLSGKKVRPRLYIALGISGQVQHLVGMRDSKNVISVNIDPNAPISAESDYFFVGDLYKILPLTNQILRQRLG